MSLYVSPEQFYIVDNATFAKENKSQISLLKKILWGFVIFSACALLRASFTTPYYEAIWYAYFVYTVMLVGSTCLIFYLFMGFSSPGHLSTMAKLDKRQLFYFIKALLWCWNNKFLSLPLWIIIFSDLLTTSLILIYDLTGWYIDISPYVSILDIFPSIWLPGHDLSSETYRFANTLYVYTYYLSYVLWFSLVITIPLSFKDILRNKDTVKKDPLKYHGRKKKHTTFKLTLKILFGIFVTIPFFSIFVFLYIFYGVDGFYAESIIKSDDLNSYTPVPVGNISDGVYTLLNYYFAKCTGVLFVLGVFFIIKILVLYFYTILYLKNKKSR